MGDIGSLYFSIFYKDNPEELEKIKASALKQLQDMNLVSKVSASVRKKELIDSIKSTLSSEQFEIGVTLDKDKLIKSLRGTLEKSGLSGNGCNPDEFRAIRARAAQERAEAYVSAQRELARLRAASATKAELKLVEARERSAKAARTHASATLNMNGAMESQLSITGQLSNQMLSLYSVYTLERFVRGLIEIGGEFEQQELALSAMLNDAGKAHEIFGKIKNLAVVSPFGVRELNSYTKQLKAFSIPYNELYETTERLADISAGVGVDMGRIILAYGQVRSAAFLRGQELRQFTEAGIPMVEALADKFSKLENRVVSAGEVIDMISKKKVSFGDVKDVLWEMTGDGGKFHNMQEILSESLSAKWKNLGDAIDIMMADIAASTNGPLKGTAEILTELTSNWKSLIPVIEAAVIAFGSQRVIAFAANRAMGEENMLLIKGTLAAKEKAAANLIVTSSYRKLNNAEKGVIASSRNMSTANWKILASSGQLTKEYALRMIALGKLKSGQAGHIAQLLDISKAEMKAALSAGRYKVMLYGLGAGIRGVGSALKTLVWNPYTAIFAGIAIVMSGWQRMKQKADDMKQHIEEVSKTAQEGFKKLNSEAKKFTDIDPVSAKESSLITSIQKIKELLRDYSPVWANTFNNVFALDEEGKQINGLAKQYTKLYDSLNDVKEGYKILADIKSVAEFANSDTDGWFDESFVENLKDASNAYEEMEKRASNITTDYVKSYEAMQKVLNSNKDFAKVATGASLKNQLMLLRAFPEALKDFGDYTRDAQGYYSVMFIKFSESIFNYKTDLDVAGKDLYEFIESYKTRLQGLKVDLNKLSEPQKIAIALNVTQFMDNIEGLNPELKKMLLKESLEREFKIKVTTEFEDKVQGLTQIQEMFDEATDHQFTAQIKTSTDPNEIIDNIQRAYKEADSAVKQMKPVLLKFGVTFDKKGKANIDSISSVASPAIKSMAEEFNKRQNEIIGGNSGANILGFSIKDIKKDLALEALKERFKQIQDFKTMYEKYIDTYGKIEALAKTKASGLFAADLFKDSTPESIRQDINKEIDKIIKESGSNTKDRRALTESGFKLKGEIIFEADKEKIQQILSELDKYISDESKKWDLFKNMYDNTGDKELAMKFAFGGSVSFENEADQWKAEIEKVLLKNGKNDIDISRLLGLSPDNIKKEIGGGLGKTLSRYVKEYQDSNSKIQAETLKNITSLISKYKDYNQQIIDIEEKATKDIQDLEKQRLIIGPDVERIIAEREKRRDEDKAGVGFKQLKESEEWAKVFDDLDRVGTISINHLIEMLEAYKVSAGKNLKVTEYKELINALRKLREESIDRNPFKNFGTHVKDYIESLKEAVKAKERYDAVLHSKIVINNKETSVEDALEDAQSDTVRKGIENAEVTIEVTDAEGKATKVTTTFAKALKLLADAQDKVQESADPLKKAFGKIAEWSDVAADGLSDLSSMFDSLGGGGITDTLDMLSGIASGIGSIAGGIAAGDPVSIASGAISGITGIISSIAQAHDKKLDRAIEKSKVRAQQLQNAYDEIERSLEHFLGSASDLTLVDAENDRARLNELNSKINAIRSKEGITLFDLKNLQKYSREAEKLQRRVTAYNQGKAFGYQRVLMKEQLEELEKQRQAELDKKKTDDSKVLDYDAQIAEMKQQIKDFAEEAAESLYGINLKEWASQLGDALYEAWKKGEDGAEAFKKKSVELIGEVMNEMLKVGYLMPRMQNIQKKLFGEDGKSGYFGTDGELDEHEIADIGKDLMELSDASKKWSKTYDQLYDWVKENYGKEAADALKGGNEESSGLSKGVQGVTESTADLLASYVNGVRADVAAEVMIARQIVDEYFPRANFLAEAQLNELRAISANTAANAAFVEEIRDMLRRSQNGMKPFSVH